MSVKNVRRKNRKRHPYTGSRRFDTTCRHRDACVYCVRNVRRNQARRSPMIDLRPWVMTAVLYDGFAEITDELADVLRAKLRV